MSAARSEALTQSKDPYQLPTSDAASKSLSRWLVDIMRTLFFGKLGGPKTKIDVIPNRAVRPVRACPELAEGNLLSHHAITAALPLRGKSRLGKPKPLLLALGEPAKDPWFVILSEVGAARSEAPTQSKDPYMRLGCRCSLWEFSLGCSASIALRPPTAENSAGILRLHLSRASRETNSAQDDSAGWKSGRSGPRK